MVKPKTGRGFLAIRQAFGSELVKEWPRFGGLQVVRVPLGMSAEELVAAFRQQEDVEFAEPAHYFHPLALPPIDPNDAKFVDGSQWNLKNAATPTADISAPEAWVYRNTAHESVVAVIDSGARLTHEDLKLNLWRNPGESGDGKETNGTDDDNNGYTNDVHGIDAFNNTGNPTDVCGHGTAVAGVLGAVGNNCVGISGVAWGIKIMVLRVNTTDCLNYSLEAIIEAIDYAIANGAHVINASFGGVSSQALETAIRVAGNSGIPVVCAAGNSPVPYPSYPALYSLENVVSVIATKKDDTFASSYSSYGLVETDLAAPGGDVGGLIWSTSFAGDASYSESAGTSFSAPHVAGALAMLRSQFPGESYLHHINRLLNSVDKLSGLANFCQTEGRLNLHAALTSPSSKPANDILGISTAFPLGYLSTSSTATRTITANNLNSAKESGEPNHAGNAGGRSVWWRFTPSSQVAGNTTISTKGSSFRTLLAVYTGSSVNNLTAVNSAAAADEFSSAILQFNAQAGTTYWIAVDGHNNSSGIIRLYLARNAGTFETARIKFDTSTIQRKRSQTRFQVSVQGPANTTVTLEKATSLSDADPNPWSSAGTVALNGSGIGTFIDSSATIGQRFYRAHISAGSVYVSTSANCVGYTDLTVPTGQSMRANQFKAGSYTLASMLPSTALENAVPNGTVVYKYDAGYDGSEYIDGAWSFPNFTLGLGEGFVVQIPSAQTWTFVGQVPEGVIETMIPSGYSIRSSQVPISGRVSANLSLPVTSGDSVNRMTSSGVFTSYSYHNGIWSPEEPGISVGESFFIFRPNTWHKPFEIWPRTR